MAIEDVLDQKAFEKLYLELEKAVYNTVYRWVWNESDALDLTQEAFVRLWSSREKVTLVRAKAYVFKTALNLAVDRHRFQKIRRWIGLEDQSFQESDPGKSQETELITAERLQWVREAVERLPMKIRKVVILARFAGLRYSEIAELLGIPEGTVGSRYNKGVSLMRNDLEQLEGTHSRGFRKSRQGGM